MDYKSKAKDSFETKLGLYIFSRVISENNSLSVDEFTNFVITEDLVNSYTTEYWNQLYEYRINDKSINEIYKAIEKLKKDNGSLIEVMKYNYISKEFEKVFPKNDFAEVTSIKECCYCGITKEKIESLADNKKLFKKNFRGWNLELERFNSNFEYSKSNCAMACYWCNNAKTDEFTKEEFLKVGELMNQIWQARLIAK